MEQLINLDKELFVFLNGLGSEPFDGFWKIITKQIYWSPLFVGVFYLIQKKVGWKGLGIIILFLAILINQKIKGVTLYKILIYLPVIVSIVVAAIAFKWLYADQGILNYFVCIGRILQ